MSAPRRGGREHRVVPDAEPRTYYGRPVLKPPVWKAEYIPSYLFAGGLAAGSSLLALGASLTGRPRLARRSRVAATTAIAASAGLLIADLGRPERFLNMLRVFRPTSPMSMGSWLLAIYGPATGVAAVTDLAGVFPRLGRAAEALAAALAPAVGTYTAVLVADTAVPAWHEARAELPFLFASSSAASAGGLGLLAAPAGEAAPARRLAVAGALGEVAASRAMERRLGELAAPYHRGRTRRLRALAEGLALAGAALATLGRWRPAASAAAGVATLAGSALTRLALFEAGLDSARDPEATVGPQRRRLRERAGGAAAG